MTRFPFVLEQYLVNELADALNIDQASVRSAIESWIGRGVLRETDDNTIILLEKRESGTGPTRASASRGLFFFLLFSVTFERTGKKVVEEQAPTVITIEQQEAEQMRVYWKVIVTLYHIRKKPIC